MQALTLQLLFATGISLCAAVILFPLFIKLSPQLGLVDVPDYRKFHLHPIPAIGGFVISLCLVTAAVFSASMREFVLKHLAMNMAFIVIMLTGFFDDRLNLSVKLRLGIQVFCALVLAYEGARINSLHGLFGIYEIPGVIQYILTVIIIAGVTNAFNLMDGIDGLAGSMALVNVGVLTAISILLNNTGWLFVLLPLTVALLVFLCYNWRPARIFMGDSGSLVFGFMISALGINFIKESEPLSPALNAEVTVLVTGYCIVPVMDALRVFYGRMKKGKSPFFADRTHLHHLLIKHYLVHSKATQKLLKLHVGIIILSAIGTLFFSLYWVIIGQIMAVFFYINFLQMMSSFYRWYRVIKKMELAS